MTEQEIQAAKRKEREDRILSAWDKLALNKALEVVFLEDLQSKFSPFESSFQGPEFNPHAAAHRDGAKQVIGHIWKRLEAAKARITADKAKPKPTQAVV